jgi:hypothetical protein
MYHDNGDDPRPTIIHHPIPREWMRPTREEVDDLRRRVERVEAMVSLHLEDHLPRPRIISSPFPLRPQDV